MWDKNLYSLYWFIHLLCIFAIYLYYFLTLIQCVVPPMRYSPSQISHRLLFFKNNMAISHGIKSFGKRLIQHGTPLDNDSCQETCHCVGFPWPVASFRVYPPATAWGPLWAVGSYLLQCSPSWTIGAQLVSPCSLSWATGDSQFQHLEHLFLILLQLPCLHHCSLTFYYSSLSQLLCRECLPILKHVITEALLMLLISSALCSVQHLSRSWWLLADTSKTLPYKFTILPENELLKNIRFWCLVEGLDCFMVPLWLKKHISNQRN